MNFDPWEDERKLRDPVTVSSAPQIDYVNHPPHYGGHPSGVECIAITRRLSFNIGNAVKYVWRAERKNGEEDLRKAEWYLQDARANNETINVTASLRATLSLVVPVEPQEWKRRFYVALMVGDTDGMRNALFTQIEPK